MAWLTGWTHREKLTIQHANVDSALTDFPVCVKLSADADYSDALATGADIRFTDSDGETLLKHEMESWVGGGGGAVTADFWVKLPSISAVAGTDFYVYWEKADAADAQDAANVWDAHFQAVYHLHDDFLDSSGNGRTLTNSNSTDAPGKVGDCQSLDGGDYLIDGTGPTGESDWTLEAIVDANTGSSTLLFTIIGKCDGSGHDGFYLARYNRGLRMQVDDGAIQSYMNSGSEFSVSAWHHVAGTYDYSTGNSQTFIDGAEDSGAGSAGASAGIGTDYHLTIGARNDGAEERWNGEIDEVRISSTLRSAAWIKFTKYNIFEADNELTWGGKETVAAGGRKAPILGGAIGLGA